MQFYLKSIFQLFWEDTNKWILIITSMKWCVQASPDRNHSRRRKGLPVIFLYCNTKHSADGLQKNYDRATLTPTPTEEALNSCQNKN